MIVLSPFFFGPLLDLLSDVLGSLIIMKQFCEFYPLVQIFVFLF